ncbi:unnamed protein product [Strongylus vulgaris]|uniref:Uncharacterized protein n=1 Tax=Strongylus vulgaris TaxID=40348 RepID=A0A3P7JT66_STRVU|nr:unnamed protein product [Strongylus vulgaris]
MRNMPEPFTFKFTAPLVRFATGGQPVASDIQQLIESIPNFVVNVPGLGDVDISKLDPNLISHVLRGGQIPGIPKETLDSIVQQYMLKMHEAAAAAQRGTPMPNSEKFLPTLDRLPQELIAAVIQGDTLPGLNETQTETIKVSSGNEQAPTSLFFRFQLLIFLTNFNH